MQYFEQDVKHLAQDCKNLWNYQIAISESANLLMTFGTQTGGGEQEIILYLSKASFWKLLANLDFLFYFEFPRFLHFFLKNFSLPPPKKPHK